MLNGSDPREKRARRPFPLGVAAFLRDTQHLSADEIGAYLLILMAMWSRSECDFPDDDHRLARLCRISPRLWKARIGTAVRPFFEASDGRLVSAWLQAEAEAIERPYRDKLSKAKDGGGAEARSARPSTRARSKPDQESAGPADPQPADPSPARPAPPPEADEAPALYEAVLAAAGIDWTRDVTGKWLGSTQRWHVRRWRDLGLSQDEILGVIAESGPRGSPPGSLAYFDAAMQRAAGRKTEPPLEPAAGDARPRRETLDREAFFAALNRDP